MKHQRKDYDTRVICTDGSIPDDEPVFLLRGKDPTAAAVVRHWLRLNQDRPSGQLSLVANHAIKMDNYANGEPSNGCAC